MTSLEQISACYQLLTQSIHSGGMNRGDSRPFLYNMTTMGEYVGPSVLNDSMIHRESRDEHRLSGLVLCTRDLLNVRIII